MGKKWILALTSAFIISLVGGVVAVSAAQNNDEVRNGFRSESSAEFRAERAQERLAVLQAEATELGISTEGLAIEDLRVKIRESRTLAKATELGIVTEGKDIDALHEEIRDLERAAAEAKVLKAATDLGITTDNKTHLQLVLEIKEKFPTEFAALDLNSPGGFGGHGGRGGNGGFCGQGSFGDSDSYRGQGGRGDRGGRGGPNNYAPAESAQAPSA